MVSWTDYTCCSRRTQFWKTRSKKSSKRNCWTIIRSILRSEQKRCRPIDPSLAEKKREETLVFNFCIQNKPLTRLFRVSLQMKNLLLCRIRNLGSSQTHMRWKTQTITMKNSISPEKQPNVLQHHLPSDPKLQVPHKKVRKAEIKVSWPPQSHSKDHFIIPEINLEKV